MVASFDRIVAAAPSFRDQYAKEIDIEPGRSATFVVSYPKSGRTWHRALVGSYIALVSGADQSRVFSLDALTPRIGLGRIRYTHNGANFIDGLEPGDPLVANAELWRGKRVVFLVRDVRDILVSAWHHARFRESLTEADLPAFIRFPRTGIEKVLTAYNRWHRALDLASASLVISYEDLHRDTAGVLRRTLRFLSSDRVAVDDDRVRQAVEECRFAVMQTRELSGFYGTEIATTTTSDERARKARSGQVGGFAAHLTEDDLAFVAEAETRLGNPFRHA